MTASTLTTQSQFFADASKPTQYCPQKRTNPTDKFKCHAAITYTVGSSLYPVATLHYSEEADRYILQLHCRDGYIGGVYRYDDSLWLNQNLEIVHNQVIAVFKFNGISYDDVIVYDHQRGDERLINGSSAYVSCADGCENIVLRSCPDYRCVSVKALYYSDDDGFNFDLRGRACCLTEALDNLNLIMQRCKVGDVLWLWHGAFSICEVAWCKDRGIKL